MFYSNKRKCWRVNLWSVEYLDDKNELTDCWKAGTVAEQRTRMNSPETALNGLWCCVCSWGKEKLNTGIFKKKKNKQGFSLRVSSLTNRHVDSRLSMFFFPASSTCLKILSEFDIFYWSIWEKKKKRMMLTVSIFNSRGQPVLNNHDVQIWFHT